MGVSRQAKVVVAGVVAALLVGVVGVVALERYLDQRSTGVWKGALPAGRGPAPPETGVWFGAFVQSQTQTPQGRSAATAAFERQLGAPMSIVHTFHPWDDAFPSAYDRAVVEDGKLLMLSWAGTDTRSMARGDHDAVIRARAEAVRDLDAPVLLRFRWEMDRPNLQDEVHSPADYIAAWKHVRQIFTEVGATNAGWVWCPLATGFATGRAQQYYPGDDQVEWICADAYPGKEFRSFAQLMDPVMAWARAHPRPVLVGEFGVRERGAGARASWLREMHAYVERQPQIKALVYFLARKTTRPMYDFTFDDEPDALSAFRSVVRTLEARSPAPPR